MGVSDEMNISDEMNQLLEHIAVGAVVRRGDTLVIGIDPSAPAERASLLADAMQSWSTETGVSVVILPAVSLAVIRSGDEP